MTISQLSQTLLSEISQRVTMILRITWILPITSLQTLITRFQELIGNMQQLIKLI